MKRNIICQTSRFFGGLETKKTTAELNLYVLERWKTSSKKSDTRRARLSQTLLLAHSMSLNTNNENMLYLDLCGCLKPGNGDAYYITSYAQLSKLGHDL